MALAGRRRPRIIVLPASGGSDPGHPPVKMSPFSMTRKARPVQKQDVFLIDLAKGTAVPADSAGNESTRAPAHLSGTEISIQPVSRLETRKAMAKAGLLTTSDVVDMSALASKLEKRAAALNAELPRKTWQFGK